VFDIGFSELVLVFVIGLIVLGPQRLPVAVKTVVGWIRAIRSLAANVQNELAQELKLQELQDSLKKVEEAGRGTLSPELKESMEELRKTADSMKRSVSQSIDIEKEEDEANTIHSPLHGSAYSEPTKPAQVTEPQPVMPAATDHQASTPAQATAAVADPASPAAERPAAASTPAQAQTAVAAPASPSTERPATASAPAQAPASQADASGSRPDSAPPARSSSSSVSDER